MIEILQAILLGIVQGITEWLPVSSTGHMILVDELWPMAMRKEFVDLFLVVIQFGSILAVLILYWHTLWPFSPTKSAEEKKNTWKLWGKIVIAAIPAAIVGYLFDDYIDAVLYNAITVAIALIVYGVLFILLENRNRASQINRLEDVSPLDALKIGFFQILALIPGTSRSGSTILGAVWIGCARDVAAEFSFFLAVPMMAGASGLKIIKFMTGTAGGFTGHELAVLGVGTLTAFVVSLLAIKFLMGYIKKHTFKAFGWYRIFLGIAVIAYFLLIK